MLNKNTNELSIADTLGDIFTRSFVYILWRRNKFRKMKVVSPVVLRIKTATGIEYVVSTSYHSDNPIVSLTTCTMPCSNVVAYTIKFCHIDYILVRDGKLAPTVLRAMPSPMVKVNGAFDITECSTMMLHPPKITSTIHDPDIKIKNT